MKKDRTPGDSMAIKMEVVCPNDTNPLGILQGGRMVQWMDLTSAICAQNHAGFICVTASIDRVGFKVPAQNGDIITIQCKVTRVFKTSMEIHAIAWKRNIRMKTPAMINEAFFTFVAVDDAGKAITIPPVVPVSKEEKAAFNDAGKRRAQRIITAHEKVTGEY
jgi:acyl-CoA hydrolase